MAQPPNNARLTKGPIAKTLVKLTIPMFFGLLSIVAFNLVDAFFVSKIGTKELAAISFTFPVVLIINNLALGLGVGTAAVVSRAIGEGNHHKVKRLTTDSIILVIILGAVLVIFGLKSIDPLFRLLGAKSETLPLIKQYMFIWYLGIVFVFIPMVGNSAIRATGDTKIPSLIMVFSVIINIILDPLMIFGIGPFPKWGIVGAAVATVIARAASMVLGFWVLYFRDKMLTFDVPTIDEIGDSFKKILYIGVPTALTRSVLPLAIGVITRIISAYGEGAVAGFGVATRIEFFALTIVMSLSSVLGPFVGQNWGARKFSRMKEGINLSTRFSNIYGFAIYALLALAAKPLALLFSNNSKVVSTIVLYLRIVPLSYGLQGVLLLNGTTLNVLHKPIHASSLSIVQMFVLLIPFALIGSFFFKIPGLFFAIAIAYILAGIISYFVLNNVVINATQK